MNKVASRDKSILKRALHLSGCGLKGVCPGCGDFSSHLVVDHWHDGGDLHGMLICYHCNSRLNNRKLTSVKSRLRFLSSSNTCYAVPVHIVLYGGISRCSQCGLCPASSSHLSFIQSTNYNEVIVTLVCQLCYDRMSRRFRRVESTEDSRLEALKLQLRHGSRALCDITSDVDKLDLFISKTFNDLNELCSELKE